MKRNVIRNSSERIFTKGPLLLRTHGAEDEVEGMLSSDLDYFLATSELGSVERRWLEFLKQSDRYGYEPENPADNVFEIARNMKSDDAVGRFFKALADVDPPFDPFSYSIPLDALPDDMRRYVEKIRKYVSAEFYKYETFVVGKKNVLVMYERTETRTEMPLINGERGFDFVVVRLYSNVDVFCRGDVSVLYERLNGTEPENWKVERDLTYDRSEPAYLTTGGNRTGIDFKSARTISRIFA